MIPSFPPREGQVGFLYLPPYRVQGISIAGEQTTLQVPELDICFDIGLCPRVVLPTPTIALTHAHMDHVGGLPYWFSQRVFQKLGPGRCVCHPRTAEPLRAMMRAWIEVEQQRTPHEILALEPDAEMPLKGNVLLRAVEVSHTCPALGYVALERRSKLRPEFAGLPQERIRELKARGEQITRVVEVPLVAVTGDTEPGPFLFRDDFATARIVLAECTFFEPEHRGRARIGKHLHIEDIASLLKVWQAEHVVLVHVSRRTNLAYARERIAAVCGDDAQRVLMLMDHRANRMRHERLLAAAASDAAAPPRAEEIDAASGADG